MNSRSAIKSWPIRTYIFGAICAATVVIMAAVGAAQQRPQPKPTNLQVLDSTITHDELIDQMGKFTNALGVGCDYCHSPSKDPNSRDMDFASDAKKEKIVARAMMKMTRDINGTYLANVTGLEAPLVAVECMTCHRGQTELIQLADLLSKTLAEKGMVAVDSTYRELREQYYGSGTFDFSEGVLVHLAYDISEEDSKDALSLLKLNQEFNPKSSFNQWAMGQLYLSTGDTTQAITEYKRALELDPKNRRAKRGLESLGVKTE